MTEELIAEQLVAVDGLVELDPLGDAERQNSKNRAKVSGQRPNALLYSSGVGAVVDLPNMTVMPAGLDAWDTIYARREHQTTISEPRLLDVVLLAHDVDRTRLAQAFRGQHVTRRVVLGAQRRVPEDGQPRS